MNVLLAGATGAVGEPIVRALVSAGDRVTGIVRSAAGAQRLRALGADVVTADVLERDVLLRTVDGLRFDTVVHELTALKKAPAQFGDMNTTNELRTRGTTHLLEAAHAVGATRFVTQSIVLGYGFQDHGIEPVTESGPFGQTHGDKFDPIIEAMTSAENQVFDDPDIDGIALRYGLFYGRDLTTMSELLRKKRLPVTASNGTLALVHHDDAAAATIAAVRHGNPNTAYNIVDDAPVTWRDYLKTVADATGTPRPRQLPGWLVRAVAPYAGRLISQVSMRVANTKAADELGWRPRYPSAAEGIKASLAVTGRARPGLSRPVAEGK